MYAHAQQSTAQRSRSSTKIFAATGSERKRESGPRPRHARPRSVRTEPRRAASALLSHSALLAAQTPGWRLI